MPPRAIALPTGRCRWSTTYPKVPRGRATLSGVLRAMQGRGCRDPESLRGGGIVERVCSTLQGQEGREPVRGHVGTSGATDRCCGGHEFCHAAAAVRSSGCYFNARPRERFSTERGGDLRRRAQPILYETDPDTDSCPHARARAAAAAAAAVVAAAAAAADDDDDGNDDVLERFRLPETYLEPIPDVVGAQNGTFLVLSACSSAIPALSAVPTELVCVITPLRGRPRGVAGAPPARTGRSTSSDRGPYPKTRVERRVRRAARRGLAGSSPTSAACDAFYVPPPATKSSRTRNGPYPMPSAAGRHVATI